MEQVNTSYQPQGASASGLLLEVERLPEAVDRDKANGAFTDDKDHGTDG